ncbi:formimidoylglutamate deiminase [Intrasporangium calvum]|uniref:Formiminoglutamate deiminase n=1 Tax=Intrasporangium calvum (strain ATCC 23552 / DSM 43043 / JCM 3097 / NBRC 12989 / NCIMB 10167 / NRRL B-3866 / 7 KIP) TaxID=710696 RepID=E6SEE1_INTC7|nr:formimidoylglutamate deiminase [Intrasporangium calvum]ADU49818.1 formiminoglutamate deiminase [Intrasporangium calvum DSM 43043]AXG14671.1 formimidoylglutamate deiminase [Intrasporangium calvum]
MTSFWCESAWLTGGFAKRVRLVVTAGLLREVHVDTDPEERDVILEGVTLPGMANTHSHAFHRALRGRVNGGGGNFWNWREQMYQVAAQLNPDTYLALARAVFAEMVLAGFTLVGEFHYVHHRPGGKKFGDPNAMSLAVRQAADEAGIRLTLLDTCYLEGGLNGGGHVELHPGQLRFSDGSVDAWAERMLARRTETDRARLGAAIHSIRAVRKEDLPRVVEAAGGMPLHVHLSEQPGENMACQMFYGCTPTELLDDAGALGHHVTSIHATHLTDRDIELLGATGTGACFCPTTERDLADGIGPARALHDAGAPLSLGTDQHVIIDPYEELRGLEMHERLITNERDRFTPSELLQSASFNGYRALGWSDGGHLSKGALADFVTVRTDTVNTAGSAPEQIIYSCVASDVSTVVVGGDIVVRDGQHRLGDVGRLLGSSIERVVTAAVGS